MAREVRNIGEYLDAELIGRGGFGSVYRADDPDHGRQVAIKVLDLTLGEDERRRFDRERLLLGQLSSHPNIISVFDSGFTEHGEAYIVMELATEGSLRDELDRRGRFRWEEALRLMIPVTSAVAAAHARGIVHRDIKPDNILIDDYGNPRLTDFGIAALTSGATSTQAASATLAHAAPEVLEGTAGTEATDVYALASTLHTLIAGTPPFVRASDEGLSAMIRRILAEPPPDLRQFGVPDDLAATVEQGLAKDPNDRPPTATEFAAALERSAVGVAGAPGRPAPGGPAAGPVAFGGTQPGAPSAPTGPGNRRNLILVGLVGAVVLLLGVTAAFAFAGGDSDGGQEAGSSTSVVPSSTVESTTTTAPLPTPVISVECAPEVALGQRITCRVTSDDVVSGTWVLPGLVDVPIALETVNGVSEIILEPLVAQAAGSTYTLTATAAAEDGTEVSAQSQFAIASPRVTILCPPTIAADSTVLCEVESLHAVRGTWSIPGFGAGPMDTVPGSNPIYVNPNSSVIGQSFTATVTVEDDFGLSASSSSQFTVTAAGG